MEVELLLEGRTREPWLGTRAWVFGAVGLVAGRNGASVTAVEKGGWAGREEVEVVGKVDGMRQNLLGCGDGGRRGFDVGRGDGTGLVVGHGGGYVGRLGGAVVSGKR